MIFWEISGIMIDFHFIENNKSSKEMKKALIVEVDESMRNLLVKFLVREGFEVAVANSGREAGGKISQDRYDLIIIDENIYKQNQFDIKSLITEVMPDAKVIYIAPFYALSEDIEFEDERVIKCGDKLFRISELKRMI